MNVDDSNGSSGKRGRRPVCTKCGQILTRNRYDKCIWCGQPVPDEFKLTDEERNAYVEKQHQQKMDLITKEKQRVRNAAERSTFLQ